MTARRPAEMEVREMKSGRSNHQSAPSMQKFLKLSRGEWSSGYESVSNLLNHLSRRSKSESARETYLRELKLFCTYVGMNPDDVIGLSKGEAEELVQEYVDTYNGSDYSPRTANKALAALKSFFRENGFKGSRALDVEGYHVPTRYRKTDEYIPRKHEIYRMADSAHSLRDRAMILTLYSTGLRNSTLRALLYKDVREELLSGMSNPKIPVYHGMKRVIPNACKNGLPYYVFTCDDATEAIRLYLQERVDKYGSIGSNDPLFASNHNQVSRATRNSKFLSSRQVRNVVKSAAKLAGISQWKDVRPHSLRKSFETVLHSETCDGGRLDPKIQEFLMGHILPGSQDNYFDMTKVEEIRAEYSKLNFGRVVVENKFERLRKAVSEAFRGTGEDPEEIMREYIRRQERLKKGLK